MMSQGSTANETRLPVRWIVMFSGSTATADYQPAASAAESPSLVKEVTDMCVDFHPHVDIRLFPKDGEALLFWQARATKDWIVTRVTTAPNPEGTRIALEYCSLVFKDEEFRKLGYNPFRAGDFSLQDQVRQQFLSHEVEPLTFELPRETLPENVNGIGYPANGTGPNGTNGSTAPTAPISGPALTADSLSSPENFAALRDYCDSLSASENPRPPKTFATWWSSHGEPPAGYFDIILRAASPKPLEIREGMGAVEALVSQTKSSLPNAPVDDANAVALSQSILKKADELQTMFSTAASRVNTESADEFRARMEEAAAHARSIAEDIGIYRKRLEPTLTTADGARLDELTGRYDLLYREMPKIRHPNPFAVRSGSDKTVSGRIPSDKTISGRVPTIKNGTTTANVGSNGTTTAKANTGGRTGFNPVYLVAVVVLAGLAFAAVKIFGKPAVTPTPKAASPKPGNNGGNKSSGTPPVAVVDPAKAILLKYEDAITVKAKRQAGKEAKQAALESGKELSDAQVQKIVVSAIKDTYKDRLPSDDYKKAFGSQEWDYGKFEKTLTKAVPEVWGEAKAKEGEGRGEYVTNKAAADAAKEKAAADERARQEAERQRQEDERKAQAEKNRKNSSGDEGSGKRHTANSGDRNSDGGRKPKGESGGTKGSGNSSSGNSTGSAGQTGL